MVIGLAKPSGLLDLTFGRRRIRARRDRIETILAGDACSEATQAAIAAMQAVIVTTVIVPSVT